MKANRYIAKAIYTVDQMDKESNGKNSAPLMLLSHAGMGKTSTVRLYCKYMDYNLITIIPSQSSADDILGLQSVKDGKLVRLTPSWFNHLEEVMKNGKRTILFIDEISTCDSYIQGPLLDLIFSHSLGERRLDSNCLIIAAGNYAVDLNNDFRMTAPLVNRFLLLNLEKADYSINEILNNTFDELKTEKEIGKFLGLEKVKDFKPLYSFEKFVNWIKTSKDVIFGKTNIEDDPDIGLLGFTSVRSLTYCLDYAKKYFTLFDDNDWIRIVGDTLGTSNKRDTKSGDGMPMRHILDSYKEEFIADTDTKITESISDVCKRMKKMGYSAADLEKINAMLDMIKPNEITDQDITEFMDLDSILNPSDYENGDVVKVIQKFAGVVQQRDAEAANTKADTNSSKK